MDVRLQRLSDYPVFLGTVKHGDCGSECGKIRENVGQLQRCQITEVRLHINVTYIRTGKCTEVKCYHTCMYTCKYEGF